MFKSIFIKYISAFLIIITISFVIIALIISAMITNYSIDEKQNTMSRTAFVSAQHVQSLFISSPFDDFSDFIKDPPYLDEISKRLLSYAEFAEDFNIFIVLPTGEIVACSHGMDIFKEQSLDLSILQSIGEEQQQATRFTTLGDLFTYRHLVLPEPLKRNDEVIGVLFVISASATFDRFVGTTTRTIIISCLWVLLATMVVIYFITEKIVSPLTDMVRAAKNFEAGHFDVRVKATGNDEVSQLATAFNSMAASLAKNEDMRRTFLSNVSHDLRTPMTTIAGFIDGIIDGTIPPEKHGYYLNIIASEIRRLSRLVSSMLDITRIQAGERTFNKTNFDICETARRILISFEHKIDTKKLDVTFDSFADNIMVYGDPDAIHQVLYNLIENAIKFSSESGELKISFSEKEKSVHTSVYNTGEGITADDLPYVFDRFYKADPSRGLDISGVGLGLFIVRTIIAAHNSEIWVESEYGNYCRFTFSLPRVYETAAK